MSNIIPTIGRIVLYTLTAEDAAKINSRRNDAKDWMRFHIQNSNGVMVHVGNQVTTGEQFPAMIVRTWGTTPEAAVNLKVELDGSDTFWKTSTMVGEGPGFYQWMDYQKGQAAKTEKAESNLEELKKMASAGEPLVKDYATSPCRTLVTPEVTIQGNTKVTSLRQVAHPS